MSTWYTVTKNPGPLDGQGLLFRVPGRRKPFALFRWAGQYFAVSDECPHAYASLSEGKVQDYILTCPAHGAQFDIRTGKGLGAAAYDDLRTLPVRVTEDEVQVEVP